MSGLRRTNALSAKRSNRLLTLLLAILLALAPVLSPAQVRHVATTDGQLASAASLPPCHAQAETAKDPAQTPACPHCDNGHLAGCPCCDHPAPGGLPSSLSEGDPTRFTVARVQIRADGLPSAPSESSFRPPIAITA